MKKLASIRFTVLPDGLEMQARGRSPRGTPFAFGPTVVARSTVGKRLSKEQLVTVIEALQPASSE